LANRGYRVIRFDNRDIGLSTKFDKAGIPDWVAIAKAIEEKKDPPLPYTLDDMADDAVGLLDALGIKKAHIVGASMGGMIAQRVAYNHPEHTLSLASIMAGGGNTNFPVIANPEVINKIPPAGDPNDTLAFIKREVKTWTIIAGKTYPPNEEKLTKQIESALMRSYYPEGSVRQGIVSVLGFYAGRQDQLKTIKVPAIVIHGNEDPMVSIDAGKDVAANIPGADFKIINGMGHSLPDQLIDTLVDLIASNASKAKK
jgi:pimeloyl-ACP methyl ester carboxylesterase